MSQKLQTLAKVAKNPKALEEIGKQIVLTAAKAVIEERLNIKPKDADLVRRVRVGQVVPVDLINEPGMRLNPGGIAGDGWEKTWLNLGLWDRNWSENETGIGRLDQISRLGTTVKEIKAEMVLTPDEIRVAKELNIDL
ncbi:MAG TPA: hypothetical protein VGD40_25340 [Chryseosolibacter sp.]